MAVKLGANIRLMRNKVGMTQEVLARDTGIDRAYLNGIEKGQHNISVRTLLKIAAALDCEAVQLLSGVYLEPE